MILTFLCFTSGVSFSLEPGSLDPTFGDGGVVRYNNATSQAVAIQRNGKIFVVGEDLKEHAAKIMRYKTDGTLDSTFGEGGIITYNVVTQYAFPDDEFNGVAIQQDGKIVVTGGTYGIDTEDVLILRYNSDGTLDSTFGESGVVTYDSGIGEIGYALTIQQDGKIIVTGRNYIPSVAPGSVLILRYNSNGTLDNTFPEDGVVEYHSGKGDTGRGLAVQQDGNIVIVGTTGLCMCTSSNDDVLLLRYGSDGNLDTTFGTNGVVTYNGRANLYDVGNAVAIQSDGKIVVVGSEDKEHLGGMPDMLILRYNSDGTLDSTFGEDGVVTYGTANNEDFAHALALQQDGKIVVTGRTENFYTGDGKMLTLRLIGEKLTLQVPNG